MEFPLIINFSIHIINILKLERRTRNGISILSGNGALMESPVQSVENDLNYKCLVDNRINVIWSRARSSEVAAYLSPHCAL